MIPRPFEYHVPRSVPEAIALLNEYGDTAKLLAGGHSLLPMMKLRFAEPEHLIDLGKLAELKGIREVGDEIRIGAMTTENELIWSALLQSTLSAACRRRAADFRSAGALPRHARRRHLTRRSGQRSSRADDRARRIVRAGRAQQASACVPADGFFLGTYMTLLEPDEIMTEIRIPMPAAGTGYCYAKLKRKTGDFATAADGRDVAHGRRRRSPTCALR